MFCLSFEWGSTTSSWYAELALRRRVKKSAIGSVIVMVTCQPFSPGSLSARGPVAKWDWVPPRRFSAPRKGIYQLDLLTPGSSPRCAISRRHTRQSPNLRNTECGRPHRLHRVYARTLNLGLRAA